jgi:hypothetical protein
MKIPRGTFLHLVAGAASPPALSRIATAQTYPTRQITTVVPFAARGGLMAPDWVPGFFVSGAVMATGAMKATRASEGIIVANRLCTGTERSEFVGCR